MQDNIFGTLITDELKLINHRAHRSGLQHNYAIEPVQPKPDGGVSVFARLGPDLDVDRMVCYYTINGEQPVAANGSSASVKSVQ